MRSSCFQRRFDERFGQRGLTLTGDGEVRFQAVAEGHEFVDFGDDAVLLGCRADRDRRHPKFFLRDIHLADCHARLGRLQVARRGAPIQTKSDEFFIHPTFNEVKSNDLVGDHQLRSRFLDKARNRQAIFWAGSGDENIANRNLALWSWRQVRWEFFVLEFQVLKCLNCRSFQDPPN